MKLFAKSSQRRAQPVQALRLDISGAVQGIGFRPHVFRLARQHDLKGWVRNTRRGVEVCVEGVRDSINRFVREVVQPPVLFAQVQLDKVQIVPVAGIESFRILASCEDGEFNITLLPDLATCDECLDEIHDPRHRRWRYPFTNCARCGPRFTITESLPYDRARTSMQRFPMCSACRKEYEDPLDRRFHAQPIACPRCGPELRLWDAAGKTVASRDEALLQTVEHLRAGCIVAVKGVGGFHLMADAANEEAVRNLRQRKQRPAKPFALMFPSLGAVRKAAHVSVKEEGLLVSSAAPIVLLEKKASPSGDLPAASVAPGNPWLGILLPSNPLHHLLMEEFGAPLVATSGNLSEEPLCHDEREALQRLQGIADFFLVHDRPIVQPADDSIVRVVCGQEQVLRRARGYAPLPIPPGCKGPLIFGLGGHLKSTLALSGATGIHVSQHLGDLENVSAHALYEKTFENFKQFQGEQPAYIAHDSHPDYETTKFAEKTAERTLPVQHHVAHVFSCIADNRLAPPVLGVAWDGTGHGLDGSLWGGEFFTVTPDRVERFATFKKFPLPGGSQAIRQPQRSALGLLYSGYGEACFDLAEVRPGILDHELNMMREMLKQGINSPLTTSCGRLFDAVSALAGFSGSIEYEGQAAMDLEFCAMESDSGQAYGWRIDEGTGPLDADGKFQWNPRLVIDWTPLLDGVLEDVRFGAERRTIAKKFHNALAGLICEIARRAGVPQVVLTGGCFQNRLLTGLTVKRLRENRFSPFLHRQVPPNDGGLSVGQVQAALWQLEGEDG